ncbi:MAG: Dna2/Cas4 domain-containing protein [Candidatus Methanoperedens sp.]|nr:Dna2/Cas4 domain-containing protein [Candidatus Methanoperedens sp.]MCZ7394440.1 Dna2/Cas4 domain-containing protein [Candidatus Methanoperedens sp.]
MIRVSDITVYLKCPRICYFVNRGHNLVNDITPAYVERIVLKELALTYGEAFLAADKLSFLGDELDRISGEIRIIYRNELSGIDDGTLADSVSNVRSCLGNICSNLSTNGDFYTNDAQVEPRLHCEKFGLSGSPDKLIKINGELIPSIIKTGSIPQNGIWSSDRLALTAYAVLVEEQYNSSVEKGFVEYARWGKVREAVIKRHERRKVLQIRDRIKKIHDGFMPEKPKDAPCEYCGFTGICDVKSTLASRFF